jgi:hypothetical protein
MSQIKAVSNFEVFENALACVTVVVVDNDRIVCFVSFSHLQTDLLGRCDDIMLTEILSHGLNLFSQIGL